MNENEIFGLALGLAGTPWQVMEVALDPEAGRLDITWISPHAAALFTPKAVNPRGAMTRGNASGGI